MEFQCRAKKCSFWKVFQVILFFLCACWILLGICLKQHSKNDPVPSHERRALGPYKYFTMLWCENCMRIVWELYEKCVQLMLASHQPTSGFQLPASSSQLGEKPLISMRIVWEMYENCMRNASNWCSPATNRLPAVYFRVFKETQRSSRKGPDQAECNVKSNVPVVFKEPAEPLRWNVNPVLVRCQALLMLFLGVVRHHWRLDVLHISSHFKRMKGFPAVLSCLFKSTMRNVWEINF